MYKVLYKSSVEKDLKKIDKSEQKKILGKIEKELAKDPRGLGKALKGTYKGFWSFRILSYRVIYKISEKEILIIVLKIGHRKSVYK